MNHGHKHFNRALFGERLTHEANRRGLTIGQLAREFGVNSDQFYSWVRGSIAPNASNFLHLCRQLNTSPTDFYLPGDSE